LVPEPAVYSQFFSNVLKGFENFNLGSGNDYIYLSSFAVNNVVHGGDGNDQIEAGAGNDIVYGDAGNDIVDGGWGSDILYGGAGSDVFAWQGNVVGQYDRDVVKDFDYDRSDGTYDQVWLYGGYNLVWDQNSPNVLHGFLTNAATGVIWGEVTFENMTLLQSSLVEIHHIDSTTGMPVA
jgi:Ca2+-binding RTX toxin-like protein